MSFYLASTQDSLSFNFIHLCVHDTMPCFTAMQHMGCNTTLKRRQDAQLSQRDRAAGCVIVFTKSRRLEVELGDNILLIL